MVNDVSVTFILVAIASFFLLVVVAGAALLFPAWCSGAMAASGRAGGRLLDLCLAPLVWLRSAAANVHALGRKRWRDCARAARQNRAMLATACAVIIAPAALALFFQGYASTGSFEESPQDVDPIILSLLKGELLIPPAPLPPDVFTTREVELVRPALASASRKWDKLDPDFRQRLLVVFQTMQAQGYEMALLEGYRSPERQDYLASLGSHVTNAGAFQSYHQFGLAADCAFFLNGRIVISEKDPWAMRGYKLYGEAAEAAGLTWGGRWKMMDFGHVELRRPGTLARRPR